jgi:hypothetical protein
MSPFLIEILAVAALVLLFLFKLFGKKSNSAVQTYVDPNADSIVNIDLTIETSTTSSSPNSADS